MLISYFREHCDTREVFASNSCGKIAFDDMICEPSGTVHRVPQKFTTAVLSQIQIFQVGKLSKYNNEIRYLTYPKIAVKCSKIFS